MLCAEQAEKLRLDFRWAARVCSARRTRGMDEDANGLIRRLCTRIGAIIKDESLTTLLWIDQERIDRLHRLDRSRRRGVQFSFGCGS